MLLWGAVCLLLVVVVVAVLRATRRGDAPAPAPEALPPSESTVSPAAQLPFGARPSVLPSFAAVLDDTTNDSSLTHVRPLPDEQNPAEVRPALRFEPGAETAVPESEAKEERIWTAAAGKTDRGVVRVRNEDAYLIDPDLGLFVVADGMGGYAKGDVASRLAVQEIASVLRTPQSMPPPEDLVGYPRRGRELLSAVRRANAVVHAEARQAETAIIGTTILAAVFSRREPRVYVAHVGDSRCYRLRGGTLKQLTIDHTHSARGETGPKASDLYRALGVAPEIAVDLVVDRPEAGDIYLFCTDGLSRMVPEEEIIETLSKPMELDRKNALLVLAANAKGGRDNVTVITVAVSSR